MVINTQCDHVLEHMRRYGHITPLEAMKEYGIMRLAARISNLRRIGYNITTETAQSINMDGKKVTYAKYILEERNERGEVDKGHDRPIR